MPGEASKVGGGRHHRPCSNTYSGVSEGEDKGDESGGGWGAVRWRECVMHGGGRVAVVEGWEGHAPDRKTENTVQIH